MQGGDGGQEALTDHRTVRLLFFLALSSSSSSLQISPRALCVGSSKCDGFNPGSGGCRVMVVVVYRARGVAAYSRCRELGGRTGRAAPSLSLSAVRVCVCWWEGVQGVREGLLSLVLTAVSARYGGAARSRRIGFFASALAFCFS